MPPTESVVPTRQHENSMEKFSFEKKIVKFDEKTVKIFFSLETVSCELF